MWSGVVIFLVTLKAKWARIRWPDRLQVLGLLSAKLLMAAGVQLQTVGARVLVFSFPQKQARRSRSYSSLLALPLGRGFRGGKVFVPVADACRCDSRGAVRFGLCLHPPLSAPSHSLEVVSVIPNRPGVLFVFFPGVAVRWRNTKPSLWLWMGVLR